MTEQSARDLSLIMQRTSLAREYTHTRPLMALFFHAHVIWYDSWLAHRLLKKVILVYTFREKYGFGLTRKEAITEITQSQDTNWPSQDIKMKTIVAV